MLRIWGRNIRTGLLLKLFLACLVVTFMYDGYMGLYGLPRVKANTLQEVGTQGTGRDGDCLGNGQFLLPA